MFFFEIKYKSLSDSQNTDILPSTGMNKATKIIISNSHYRWQQAKKKKKNSKLYLTIKTVQSYSWL